MIEDKRLIWKFKAGDGEALKRIFLKYREFLLKLAVTMLGDAHLAEDVVHDVFVKFAQSGAKLSVKGNLKSFLATCVANRIRNVRRDRMRHKTIGLDDAGAIVDVREPAEVWLTLSAELRLLSEAMEQIPYEQREVISLHMQGDMTFKQIAGVQEVSINTVQGRYRYGIEKLRTIMDGVLKNEK